MKPQDFLIFLFIGALSGWLAGFIVYGGGLGLIGDIVVGIVGSFIAGWLMPHLQLNLGGGIAAQIIYGAIGGVVLLVIISLIRRIAY
jgi:uncharacterized membrane protein YeaQ/YmgE (transglycosylase-associated protein family)